VHRWTASSASYVMLLMPLVTIVVASAITGDAITLPFAAGSALVLAGVYLGAIRRRPGTPRRVRPAAVTHRRSSQPGCA
jgi:drug/metabolite transporter (DMT)-like permease